MRGPWKYIRIFSLYLAGLIFFAHLVVPHDHHGSDEQVNTNIPCPEQGNSQNANHGIPWHCIAFNDLIAEKVLVLVSLDKSNYSECYLTDPLEFQDDLSGNITERITISDYSVSSRYFMAPVNLRAPPAS